MHFMRAITTNGSLHRQIALVPINIVPLMPSLVVFQNPISEYDVNVERHILRLQ